MSRHLFDSPLGAQIAPKGVPKNVIGIGAAALAAGIMAAGSTINTAISNNQANLASLTAFNRQKELMDKQQEQSIALHKTNLEESYRQDLLHNSPSAQMQRYREAGLNPYLIMQHEGNIGAAVSAPAGSGSVAPAPSVQQPNLQPFQLPEMSGIANMLIASSESKKNDAESFSKIMSVVPEMGRSIGWAQTRSFLRQMMGIYGIEGSQYERMAENKVRGLELKNQRDEFELSLVKQFGPDKARLINSQLSVEIDKLQKEIEVLDSNVDLNKSSIHVNDAQIRELVTRAARNIAEKAHLDADATTINALRGALVFESKMKAGSAYYQRGVDWMNFESESAKYKGSEPQRDLEILVGKDWKELSPSERALKAAVLFERRLGGVISNWSPLKP